jgi:hypothetical protein
LGSGRNLLARSGSNVCFFARRRTGWAGFGWVWPGLDARYGLRLLQRLDTKHRFQVVAAGVWTKYYLTMDLTARATQQVVRDELRRQGLE